MSRNDRRSTLDLFLGRIEAFNEANGGGVVIRKVAQGYSLFRADAGAPWRSFTRWAGAMRSRSCGGAPGTSGSRSATSARCGCRWPRH